MTLSPRTLALKCPIQGYSFCSLTFHDIEYANAIHHCEITRAQQLVHINSIIKVRRRLNIYLEFYSVVDNV